MARLPDVIGSLSPEAQKVYDRIAAKRGAIRGPYAPLMHHPTLAGLVGDLGEFLRFDGALPGDIREMAILITARAAAQPFEWVMHAPIARTAGLPDPVIEHIRTKRELEALPARYADAAQIVAHTLARRSIPQELQDRVQAALGVNGLVELVVLTGYYSLIAAVLFSFDVPLPDGTPAPF
ncbi:MAG TPA: carboxymuconolactone decarboxylase family protein [Methylomirabilota bacterium]|nr:carboxymuconolactone decarboxylase family protein [Methylomirabilota bacterium]